MQKSRSKAAPAAPKISLQVVLIVVPLIIFFFFIGIIVGSKFASDPSSISILPGSVSIVNKIGLTHLSPNLRGLNSASGTTIATNEINKVADNSISSVDNSHIAETNITPAISQSEDHLSLRREADKAETSGALATTTSSADEKFVPEVLLKNSLPISSGSFMVGPSDLDADNIIVGTWIYLDDRPISDMRTIFTNKKSGCDRGLDQYGFSLYVNAWQQEDRKVYLEYGGESSGCNKIAAKNSINYGQWHHVAAAFTSSRASIYIDGILSGESAPNYEVHKVQRTNPWRVGQYDGGDFTLFGNVSHMAIVKNFVDESPEYVEKVVKALSSNPKNIDSIEYLYAHYPFTDYNAEESNVAQDTKLGKSGTYTKPAGSGHVISGVSIPLVDGVPKRPITEDLLRESDQQGRKHSDFIRNRMKDVWASYKRYAWGYDELKPISDRGDNNWGGMAVTLVDSLDTLWLMNLKDEFNDAKNYVERSLTFHNAGSVSVFETTIRELGGLLAAYDLSKEHVFLDKAKELGDLLLPAFHTSSGIPRAMVDFRSHQGSSGWAGNSAILSELGSLQIEFRYLSRHAKRPDIEETVMKPLHLMNSKHPAHGLFPIKVSISDGSFTDSQVTFGALGDSFYEYLLKLWLQGGKKETWLREMYDEAMNGVMDVLLQASEPSGYAFLSDWNGHSNIRKMDHLVCFMPGLLALGSFHDPKGRESARAKRDLAVAKALMYTCRQMYHEMESGISAEYVEFPRGTGTDIQVPGHVAFYILRPETAESLFILHEITKDPIYREWAWEIFQAIDQNCKTRSAYGSLRNVRRASQGVDDRMESFFLAETMKYLYLVQDPDQPIDLSKYVFNTEAHPTSIFDK